MNSPLVTVITPTYNRADYIREAVESVFGQTYTNLEMLVVDDGSTDQTREVLEPYLQDTRLKYLHQSNQGQSVARNLALSHARGEFVCFLDSDNRWLPDKIERSLAIFAEHPEVDIVYGDTITIDESGRETSRHNMPRHSGKITRYLFRDNCVSMNTTMVRRHCFEEMGGLEVGRRAADDYELWLRFSASYRFFYLPAYLAEYRVMADQISSNKERRFKSNEEILRNFLVRFPNALTPEEVREGWCYFHTRKGRYHASVGELGQAFREYRAAMRCKPLSRAPWQALARLVILRS